MAKDIETLAQWDEEERREEREKKKCGIWVVGIGQCVAERPCHAHDVKSK